MLYFLPNFIGGQFLSLAPAQALFSWVKMAFWFPLWRFISPVCSWTAIKSLLFAWGAVVRQAVLLSRNTSSTSLYFVHSTRSHAGQTWHDKEWYAVFQIKPHSCIVCWLWLVCCPLNSFFSFSVACKSVHGPVFVKWTQNTVRSKMCIFFWKTDSSF